MIGNPTQLKDKIRNLAKGNSEKAQSLMRTYMMERFLERISISPYRKNFILKGGMLIASMVGLDTRATMDIDTTVFSLSVTKEGMEEVVRSLIDVPIEDNIIFAVERISEIMEEHEYHGIRVVLSAQMDRIRQTVKLDISTGDIITPSAVEYSYKLMFENRTIPLLAYNRETLMAEKLETVMARNLANTRMRDFYDIYVLSQGRELDEELLKAAFTATCKKRGSLQLVSRFPEILRALQDDKDMQRQWERYADNAFFVKTLSWETVMGCLNNLRGALS